MLANWNENQVVSTEEWHKILENNLPFSYFYPSGETIYFMGKLVVNVGDRILLMHHCEYCGRRTQGLDRYGCCVYCGGPAWRNLDGFWNRY